MRRFLNSIFGTTLAILFATGAVSAADCFCAKPKVKFTVHHSFSPASGVKCVIDEQEIESGTEVEFERDKEYILEIAVAPSIEVNCDTSVYVEFPHCSMEQRADGASAWEKGGMARFVLDYDDELRDGTYVIVPGSYTIKISDPTSDDANSSPKPGSEVKLSATPPSIGPDAMASGLVQQPAGLALEIPLGAAKGSDGMYHSAGRIVNYGGVGASFAAPSAFAFNALPEVTGGGTPPVSQVTVPAAPSPTSEKHFIGPDAVVRLRGLDGSAVTSSFTGASGSLFEVYDPSQYNAGTMAFSGSPHSYYRVEIATGNGLASGILLTQSNRGVVRTESIQCSNDGLSTRQQMGPIVATTLMLPEYINVGTPKPLNGNWSVERTEVRDGIVISKTEESWSMKPWGKALMGSKVGIDVETNENGLLTSYDYYEDGRLKWISRPDSSWEFYEYNGTTTRTYSPWLSETLLSGGELPSSGFVTYTENTFDYDSIVTTSWFTNLSWISDPIQTSSSSSINRVASNLKGDVSWRNGLQSTNTWTLHHPDDTTPAWKAGRPIMSWDRTGKATLYSYDRGDWTEGGGLSPNPNGLYTMESATVGVIASPSDSSTTANFTVVASRSSRTVTITGPNGVVREEEWVCNASSAFEEAVSRMHEYEPDRPFRHIGVKIGGKYVSKTEYNASPLITRTWDESGTETETEFDAWGELVRESTSGDSQVPAVTTLHSRTGRTRKVQIGSIVVSTQTVDVAGRVISSKDSTDAVTKTVYTNGGRTVTQTGPGGVQKITNSHFDGRTISVTGSGVTPIYYKYHLHGEREVDEDSGLITKTTIVGDLASDRASSVTSNWDGSTASSSKPDPSSPGDTVTLTHTYDMDSDALVLVESSAANTAAQVTIPASYSPAAALGMYSLSGQETDGNGPVIASTDRLVETDTVFEKPSGSTIWHRKTTVNWFYADGSAAAHSMTSWTALAPVAISDGTQGGLRWASFEVQGGRTITTNKDNFFTNAASRVIVEDSATSVSPDRERVAKHGREISSSEYGTGSPRSTFYNGSGQVVREVSTSGAVTGYSYFPNGQLKEVRDHENVATTYEYYTADHHAAGRIWKLTRAGETTETVYNERGQVKETKGNATYRVSWEYNAWGEAFQMRTYRTASSSGDLTEWTYDGPTGLLTKKKDAGGHAVDYSYRANGRLNQRKSQRSLSPSILITTTYSWDDFGAFTGKSYDDGTPTVAITPDRLGRPKTVTDASGSRTVSYHSTTGAIDLIDYTNGLLGDRKIDYTWDGSLRSTGFSISHTGQGPMDFATSYGYDDAGRILTVSGSGTTHTHAWLPGTNIPDGVSSSALVRTLHHDRMQRLRGIENRNGGGTMITRHGYILDDVGRRTKASRENGQAWVYGYDSKGQVTSAVKSFPDGATVIPGHAFSYAYDGIGNRVTANHGGSAMGVSYYGDTSEAATGANELNQYKRIKTAGGRFILAEAPSQVTVNGSNANPAGGLGLYWSQPSADNTANPLWSTDTVASGGTTTTGKTWTPKATIDPDYDLDGNLTWDGRWNYVWDAENRLASMTTAAIAYGVNVPRQKLDFIYDGEGRRVAKTVSAWNGSAYAFVSQTRFLYDGWNIIAEYRATSATETSLGFQTIQAVHTWGPDLSGTMQGAGGVGGLLSTEVKSTSSICFPAYDGNGNISGWVKSNGTLLSRRDYSPFGQLIVNYKLDSSAAATLANLSFGFSTKFTDSESGLLYYGFRFYDAMNGRWLGRDPSGEQGGVNLYACVGNNTVNGWDYLGLWGRTFRDGRKAWATVCAEQGDDWARLAQRLRLEESEAPKWVRNHDAIPQPGKNYEIPNVVFMSLAKVPAYQWIRPHIMGVIQNDVMDRAVFYKKRGFMILPYIAMDDSEQWKRLWNVQGMYAVLTAAHGTSGSIEPGGDSSGLVSPHQVYPSYKLSEVWILACGSARPTGPKWGTYIVEWKQHVSKSGVFRGYWEDYTFYWNEEKSRRVEPGSP